MAKKIIEPSDDEIQIARAVQAVRMGMNQSEAGLFAGMWATRLRLDHFKAYIWSSVVAFNLALFARLKPT